MTFPSHSMPSLSTFYLFAFGAQPKLGRVWTDLPADGEKITGSMVFTIPSLNAVPFRSRNVLLSPQEFSNWTRRKFLKTYTYTQSLSSRNAGPTYDVQFCRSYDKPFHNLWRYPKSGFRLTLENILGATHLVFLLIDFSQLVSMFMPSLTHNVSTFPPRKNAVLGK